MPKTTRWKDIPGALRVPVEVDQDGSLYAPDFKEWLPIRLSPLPERFRGDTGTIVIAFRSTGYCSAGTYEHPPEYGDDRVCEYGLFEWESEEDGAWVTRAVRLSHDDAAMMFITYPDKIDAVELTVEQ